MTETLRLEPLKSHYYVVRLSGEGGSLEQVVVSSHDGIERIHQRLGLIDRGPVTAREDEEDEAAPAFISSYISFNDAVVRVADVVTVTPYPRAVLANFMALRQERARVEKLAAPPDFDAWDLSVFLATAEAKLAAELERVGSGGGGQRGGMRI